MVKTIDERAKKTPVAAEADVLVAGGGPAGIAAAVAAARTGAKVILLERYGYLGGLATGGLVLYMDHLFDRSGVRCIGGISWELMERLRALDGLAGAGSVHLHVDSELLKIAADDICSDSGVVLRLHSWVADVVMDGNSVAGLIVESKSGRQAILSQVCIDATGDGDVAAFAGAELEMHTMRIGLNCKIGGVDKPKFLTWKNENPADAAKVRADVRSQGGCPLGLGETPYSDEGVFWVNDLGLARRDDAEVRIAGGNDGFIGGLSAVDVDDITYAEVELRRRIRRGVDYYRKHIPGYERVRLLSIASQLGVRDSRRITGIHKLTREQMDQNVQFEDTVGYTAMQFPHGNHLRVPLRSIVPKDIGGMLTSGRCISVDDGLIHSIRVIPPCLMTGQAAGTAAALCADRKIEPRCLDYMHLRRRLESDGVILDDPAEN